MELAAAALPLTLQATLKEVEVLAYRTHRFLILIEPRDRVYEVKAELNTLIG